MKLFEQAYNIFGISSFIYVSFLYVILMFICSYSPSLKKITSIINMFIYNINDTYLHGRSYGYILFFGFYTILILNIIGISGLSLVLSNPIYSLILCVFVCGYIIIQGIIKFGIFGFLNNLVPKGTPIFLYPLMLIIEVVTLLLRPLILAFRICLINSISHMILHIFENMLGANLKFILFIMLIIDIIKSFLQAYLFILSLSLILKMCVESHD